FFSSRRRHTRSKRDWSSDVCSSDLAPVAPPLSTSSAQGGKIDSWPTHPHPRSRPVLSVNNLELRAGARLLMEDVTFRIDKGDKRSEERRVGKDGRWRGAREDDR